MTIPDTNGTFEVREIGRTGRVEVIHHPDPAEQERMFRQVLRDCYFEWATAYLLGYERRMAVIELLVIPNAAHALGVGWTPEERSARG